MNHTPKPNFFVIGVVKGGTTSLYHYLLQHPDIYLPPIKETNHFAAKDIRESDFLPEYAMDVKIDLDAYIRSGMKRQVHIAHVNDRNQYEKLFSKVKDESAIGEISNCYMICPSAAREIHDYAPGAKIMVVLRNPIHRAWSQYLMNLREAKDGDGGFIAALEADRDRTKTGWGVNHQYLELGRYASQLKRYFDLFGRENVLVMFYEEYRQSPAQVMKEICRFLGVDDGFEFDFSEESNKAGMPRSVALNKMLVKSGAIKALKGITPKSVRKKFAQALYTDKNLPRIAENEKAWLAEYYSEEMRELENLIGDGVPRWWPEFKTSNHEIR